MKHPLPILAIALLAVIALGGVPAAAGVAEDIRTATEAGHPVFVVVTDRDAEGTERAVEIARQAQALAPGAERVLLDRGAAENRQLVRSYGVLGAPVPLILVVAQNGLVAGGARLEDATPQVLVRLIPTPKKAEWLLALSKKLPVFVLAMHPEMKGREEVLAAMRKAHEKLGGKVATVGIDTRDEAELAFLRELQIDPKAPWPVVIVFNASGQKTAAFRQGATADELVAAVKKKAACCPGGSC